MQKPIQTYIVNLKTRPDRRKFIIKEFSSRPEFAVQIVDAQTSEFGALGLWNTMKAIVSEALNGREEYIIICEDDHKFTKDYSKEYLYQSIEQAQNNNMDLVFGGVSWFSNIINIGNNLFWLEDFSGTQFFVIFRKFFKTFLINSVMDESPADARMGNLTSNKVVMYPFISTQKDFGYSDATQRNNEKGRVQNLFKWAQNSLKTLESVRFFYQSLPKTSILTGEKGENLLSTYKIPTYIINLPERKDRLEHIRKEFEGRNEFDIHIIKACKHKIGAVGLWKSIRKVIKTAIANEDDVIIICEDDHSFTTAYSKEYLITNILEAHHQGACILSGGTGKFGYAVPLTENRYWTNHALSAQFVVIYKKFFQQILDEPFDKYVIADMLYSRMTSNKMLLFPFISIQANFGYSDVTPLHMEDSKIISRLFYESTNRLTTIRQAYLKYNLITA